MTEKGNKDSNVKTTHIALDIIEYIQSENGATTQELADRFGVARSTIHRHCTTLLDRELLVKPNQEYQLGLKFLELGMDAQSRVYGYDETEPIIEKLAEDTGELVEFFIEDHGQAVLVDMASGENAPQTEAMKGMRLPMHSLAAGKAMLAFMPENKIGQILDTHGLPKITANTITDRANLEEELQTIRERGYSYNREESLGRLHAIGTPILDSDEKVIGGLSVSGPTQRMVGERLEQELPPLLLGITNQLELNITHQ